MADEINRASPRTQSALLQAMQERHVTIAGSATICPRRSMCSRRRIRWSRKAPIRCPKRSSTVSCCRSTSIIRIEDAERRMLIATTFGEEAPPQTDLHAGRTDRSAALVRRLPVGEKVVDAILRLVRAARPDERCESRCATMISWGPGPRASQAFMLAIRAKALIEGRFAPSYGRCGSAGASRCCVIAWR